MFSLVLLFSWVGVHLFFVRVYYLGWVVAMFSLVLLFSWAVVLLFVAVVDLCLVVPFLTMGAEGDDSATAASDRRIIVVINAPTPMPPTAAVSNLELIEANIASGLI
jgi:hypothetical protein